MVNALSDVDGSILDCKKSIEEFDNELLSLHTEIFDRIQEQFSNLDSEISNIIDLFDEFEVSDDKGIWSKEAIAQLGLLTQQYELAQYQIQQYNNEIDELNKQYIAGRYSATEYADLLTSLTEKQWDAVKSTESAKDGILNLNEARVENQIKGIEKEIDAFDELTQAQVKALKASKDLHDYENSVAEKTKAITDLERQIAAMQNDTSAATVAKRKQLEQQLADAKAELEEAEYEHSIEVQEDALNKQYEQYEKERNEEIEALRASLNDRETILAESFETVKNNASLVGQEIASIATWHGITVSNALISSWQSGEMAIASYGEALSQNTSAFIGNIMGVENEIWNLQAQANVTANSLAWMFSARADNLVNELTTSYYAEVNLASMTNALQQSLINTLERGYDVSSIVNSLASVESAANSAKAAIDNLANASSASANSASTNKTSSNNLSGTYAVSPMNGKVLAGPSLQANYIDPKLKKYASGTRNSKGNLIITDEKGYEMKLPKLQNGQYTLANEGSQVFTKEQTDRLYELANMDTKNLIPFDELTAEAMQKLWRSAYVSAPVLNQRLNSNKPVQVGNLINVQGSIDSSNIKQMETIANKAVNNLVNKLHDGLTYGR